MTKSVFRKTMQQIVFVTLGTTAFATMPMLAQDTQSAPPATMQGPHHGGGDYATREQKRLDMMTKKLNLSPDQVTQIKAINDDEHTQMEALHSDTSTPQADKRAKMMDIHKTSSDKVRAVLNGDQQTKYDAMQAKAQERWQNRQGGGPPPPPPQQ